MWVWESKEYESPWFWPCDLRPVTLPLWAGLLIYTRGNVVAPSQVDGLEWENGMDRAWSEVKVAQSYPTLCDPMDYTVHGILQARILEWVALPFSRASSKPRNHTQVSRIAGRFFASWAKGETQEYWSG